MDIEHIIGIVTRVIAANSARPISAMADRLHDLGVQEDGRRRIAQEIELETGLEMHCDALSGRERVVDIVHRVNNGILEALPQAA